MFLLFCGMNFYPGGGVHDLVGEYDMHARAFDALQEQSIFNDWAHIYNTETGKTWKYARQGKEWEEI